MAEGAFRRAGRSQRADALEIALVEGFGDQNAHAEYQARLCAANPADCG